MELGGISAPHLLAARDRVESYAPGTPTWHGESLPDWSYAELAMNDVKSINVDTKDSAFASFESMAALNWKKALKANMVLWFFWCVFPFICYPFTSCNNTGFAKAHFALLLLYLPLVAYAMWKELAVHQKVLPVMTKFLGGYKIQTLGWNVPFRVYFVMGGMLSFLAHMDIATNAIFVTRVFKTYQCPESKVDDIWDKVVQDAAITNLPDLKWIGAGIWLMMGFQFVFALYNAYPLTPKTEFDLDFQALWKKDELKNEVRNPENRKVHGIQTCSGQVLPSDALGALADSARMYLVTFRHLKFLHIQRGGRLGFGRHSRRTWVATMLKVAWRCVLYPLLETSTMANLQASCLAVTKAAQAKAEQVDSLTTFSICLSLIMSVLTLVFASQQIWTMFRSVLPHIDQKHAEESEDDPPRNKRRLRVAVVVYLVAACLCLYLNIYASIKLLMVFQCEEGVWNWAIPLTDGCVGSEELFS